MFRSGSQKGEINAIVFVASVLLLTTQPGVAKDWTSDCTPAEGCVFFFPLNKIGDDISLRSKDFSNGISKGKS